jgi:hypothetical protein
MTTYQAQLTQTYKTPRHEVQVWCHGAEQQPVIVIDDYLDDPKALIEVAAQGPAFAPNGPYYPGIRAPFPPAHFEQLLSPILSILARHFDYQRGAILRECTFSLVTTPACDLMPIQRLPHFDSLEKGRVAALLFLGQGPSNGGTAFYRQHSTGFESVDEGRYQAFTTALNADIAHFGLPTQNYVADDNPMYETLALHEGRFNRMLVYASATLHSGRIPDDFAFNADPRHGRLTVNAFLGPDT